MAEKRPQTLDQMMGITGVGAKKLDSFGLAFLSVISGVTMAPLHPQRMKLAGRDAGQIFDRLSQEQLRLARGEDGLGKLLSCTQSALRQIAERRPASLAAMAHIQGMTEQKLDRFGDAFLSVIQES
jgi:ATP-dependent DNA helicase RecQ